MREDLMDLFLENQGGGFRGGEKTSFKRRNWLVSGRGGDVNIVKITCSY